MGGILAATVAGAQTESVPKGRGRGRGQESAPTRQAKVVKLFKAPDGHPNAMEATAEGVWVGDQVTERAHLLDWKTGQIIRKVETESHNTSGIAVGGGYLWLAANGGVSNRRPPRPTDKPVGEIVQADLQTGKTVKLHQLPWGGGCHGLVWSEPTQTLWSSAMSITALAEVNPKDNFRILRLIPVRYGRSHGMDIENGAIWVVFSTEMLIHKLDMKTGRVMEIVALANGEDPTPHGMCRHEGHFYYCDAGFEPAQTEASVSPGSGYICRIDL
jgi:streptogramin lyase